VRIEKEEGKMEQEKAWLPGEAGQCTLVERSPQARRAENVSVQPTVILISGGNDIGATTYRPLIKTIRHEARVLVKNLEVSTLALASPVYEFKQEIVGLRDAIDEAGIEQFHAVGYSGGGTVCLAFAAEYPERLQSLALIEPAWLGNQQREPAETGYWEEIDRIMLLPPAERVAAFVQFQVREDLDLTSVVHAQQLSFVQKRFTYVWTMNQAFKRYPFKQERLRQFSGPVYVGVGSLSHAHEYWKARRLAEFFPDTQIEVYEGLHHFHPPQEAEPERLARVLRDLWSRAAWS
jgi:pimeloyl-ACP methyl ester carboxylesterase